MSRPGDRASVLTLLNITEGVMHGEVWPGDRASVLTLLNITEGVIPGEVVAGR